MKIKITLTAHGADTCMVASNHNHAELLISAFLAGIGKRGATGSAYSRAIMTSHKWQKVDFMMINAQWYAEAVE